MSVNQKSVEARGKATDVWEVFTGPPVEVSLRIAEILRDIMLATQG